MGFLTDWLTDWLKSLLIEGILGNLSGLFDTVNARVGEIAGEVGTTPAAWNAGVFSLIRQISETVILPIAGLVLTYVAVYELIQMLIDRNNLHDIDTWMFFKWIFKTAAAILILSNTFNIVNAIFDVSQSVIASSAGVIQGSTDISPDMLADLEATLETMGLGSLLGLWLQSIFIGFTMTALNIVIFVLIYGRMLEIYMLTSLAPIPVATLSNREMGSMGQNYLKSLFAIGYLCGAHSRDRHRRRSHRRNMGSRGLYGFALLYAVQNRDNFKKHLWSALRKGVLYAEKIWARRDAPVVRKSAGGL